MPECMDVDLLKQHISELENKADFNDSNYHNGYMKALSDIKDIVLKRPDYLRTEIKFNRLIQCRECKFCHTFRGEIDGKQNVVKFLCEKWNYFNKYNEVDLYDFCSYGELNDNKGE